MDQEAFEDAQVLMENAEAIRKLLEQEDRPYERAQLQQQWEQAFIAASAAITAANNAAVLE
jgi:hypothetical protein